MFVSKYSEDEWNAFYESVLRIGLCLSVFFVLREKPETFMEVRWTSVSRK